eukprot:scaffold16752_cov85-Cyclotella_meneghiniana.AAC.1
MKGICGGMGAAAMIDPPEQIVACSYCANGICKPPMKLRQSEVLPSINDLTVTVTVDRRVVASFHTCDYKGVDTQASSC